MNIYNQKKIERLAAGETIISREKGNSMSKTIKSGQPVRISPITSLDEIEIGDVVFCSKGQACYTHKVWSKKEHSLQIGNQNTPSNGWIHESHIYGKITEILPINYKEKK